MVERDYNLAAVLVTGVDESEDDGTTAVAVAAAEGNLALYRECYEEPDGDWKGSGNWDRPEKRGEEEGRRKEEEEEEERYTWIDPVGGKEMEANPWRRSDLVGRPMFIVLIGFGLGIHSVTAKS